MVQVFQGQEEGPAWRLMAPQPLWGVDARQGHAGCARCGPRQEHRPSMGALGVRVGALAHTVASGCQRWCVGTQTRGAAAWTLMGTDPGWAQVLWCRCVVLVPLCVLPPGGPMFRLLLPWSLAFGLGVRRCQPRRTWLWLAWPVACGLGACSGLGAAQAQWSRAEAALRQADQPAVQADAPVELGLAREKLQRAHQALGVQDAAMAQRLAEQAELDAQVAEAHAQRVRLRREEKAARALTLSLQGRASSAGAQP